MKVLVVGGGGREHALVWKIAQSPLVSKVFCAPGNPGIEEHAQCVGLRADDVLGILQFVREKSIDLTVVGPEDPLTMGITDMLTDKGFKVFGPSKAGAELEASKVFCKELMHKHAVPTAAFKVFEHAHDAHDFIDNSPVPVVVKADGLAKGKGVVVCKSQDEAHAAVRSIMEERTFGLAGERVIIEECLKGEEASILAITDGRTIMTLEPAQDHKHAYDGDCGPNTGGMGAYSPVPRVTDKLRQEVERTVFVPVVHALKLERRKFRGVLYAGLMLASNGPNVLEFNVRWGDPEAQPLLMRMKSDIVPLLIAAADGTLKDAEVEWDERAAVCVVMASGGYPGPYAKGKPIEGLDKVAKLDDVMVFHAGTARSAGKIVTDGGRVLGVTALGANIDEAQNRAYEAVEMIRWDGVQYRKDIGHRALKL